MGCSWVVSLVGQEFCIDLGCIEIRMTEERRKDWTEWRKRKITYRCVSHGHIIAGGDHCHLRCRCSSSSGLGGARSFQGRVNGNTASARGDFEVRRCGVRSIGEVRGREAGLGGLRGRDLVRHDQLSRVRSRNWLASHS